MSSRSADERRFLRLGLAAGAASIGAVALSLLIGGASASAAEADSDSLTGTPGGVTALVAEPVLEELSPMTAPVAQTVEPVVVPSAPVAQSALAGSAALAAPVTTVAEPVAAPVTTALAPVTQPARPLVERVVAAAVTPIVAPVVDAVDGALGVLPPADELLANAAVGAEPPATTDTAAQEMTGTAGAKATLPGDADVVIAKSTIQTERVDASAIASDALPESSGAAASPRAERLALAPGPPGLAPTGANGAGGAAGQAAAIIHAHDLPALTGGQVGAIEHDRAPASPSEEHTASPD